VPKNTINEELGALKPGDVLIVPISGIAGEVHQIHKEISQQWPHSRFTVLRTLRNGVVCAKIIVGQP
jgi:preprotein translocase subunit YajC